jgi:hypothetical protein
MRVYNLAASTAAGVLDEFNQVTLEAGYETGRFAMIFAGTIVQFKRGRESAIDSYLDIYGSDGDRLQQFAVVNVSLEAGKNSPQDQYDVIAAAAAAHGVTPGVTQLPQDRIGGILPRGKVVAGNAVMSLRNLARNTDTTWSVQNGKLTVLAKQGYLGSEVLRINAQTGMISQPEATTHGIQVKILLNPSVQIGQRIQINNADINQTLWQGNQYSSGLPNKDTFKMGFPGYADTPYFADTTEDGIYRVLVVEHNGDTRGNDYYSDLVCLALDPSATSSTTGQQGVPQDVPSGSGD